MLYNAPTGSSDANAGFAGKNVAAGQQGSKVPPGAVEFPQREIVAAIAAAGLTPTNSDLQQLTRAIRSGILEYYPDTGATNAPSISPSPVHIALVDGLHVRVKMAHAPTGACTLSVNSLSAPIVRRNGLALVGGEWAVNDVIDFVYVVALSAFQIAGLVLSDTIAVALNVQRTQIVADRGSSTQTIPTNVATRVTNYGTSTVRSQGGTTFSSGLLTIGSGDAGLWFVGCHCRQTFTSNTNPGFSTNLNLNGSATPFISGGNGLSGSVPAITVHGNCARLINLAVADTIEVRMTQTTGADYTFNDLYSFSAVRLGAS